MVKKARKKYPSETGAAAPGFATGCRDPENF
jgi:hypothetical protein